MWMCIKYKSIPLTKTISIKFNLYGCDAIFHRISNFPCFYSIYFQNLIILLDINFMHNCSQFNHIRVLRRYQCASLFFIWNLKDAVQFFLHFVGEHSVGTFFFKCQTHTLRWIYQVSRETPNENPLSRECPRKYCHPLQPHKLHVFRHTFCPNEYFYIISTSS